MEKRLERPVENDTPALRLLLSFWQWKAVWIATTLLSASMGLVYAVVLKRDIWVASQGMIVRDEATATAMRLGRFESQTQMKTAQETLMEMAKNPRVIRSALSSVPSDSTIKPWPWTLSKSDGAPTAREIEAFGKKNVNIRAPHGAELGTTEIIYLDIKEKSPERAVKLAKAIGNALEEQLKLVRQNRAEGIIQELRAAEEVADNQLQLSTNKLQQMEVAAGADLADLRGLTDANSGSTNRLMLDMVRDDLRRGEIELQLHLENLESARAALENPELLAQVTARLVDTQPTIKKLREALAEASIRTTQQLGRYSELHPEVIIAQKTERQVQQRLMKELEATVSAIEGSVALTQRRMARLYEQEQELGRRLNRLAQIRADYTNSVAEVRARSEEVHQIRRDLTQAIAARDAAGTSSLITRLDEPLLNERPMGPGKTTIVGAALVGGLLLGLGIVFLLVPLEGNSFAAGQGKSEDHMSGQQGDSAAMRQAAWGAQRRSAAQHTLAAEHVSVAQTVSVAQQVSAAQEANGPQSLEAVPCPAKSISYDDFYPVIAGPMTSQPPSARI
jgi:polysaccharide biosynthesis transport protein